MLTVTYTGTGRFALDPPALQVLCRRRPTIVVPRSGSPASDDGTAAAVLCAAATGERCIEVPSDLDLDVVGDDDQVGPGLWIAVRPRGHAIRVAGPWQPLRHFQPAPAISRGIGAADEAEHLLEAVVSYANRLLRPHGQPASDLALWFTPDAIRDRLSDRAEVAALSEEQLRLVGQNALRCDSLYRTVHEVLTAALDEVIA